MRGIGSVIERRREALGMTRKGLADAMGVNASSIYRLERNDQGLAEAMERLEQIAHILDTTLYAIVTEAVGMDAQHMQQVEFVPLLTVAQASDHNRAEHLRTAPRIPLGMKTPPGSWLIPVENDAMAPALTSGSMALIDPDCPHAPRDIVAVNSATAGILLRRLVRDGVAMRLMADEWRGAPLTLEPNDEILGVAIAVYRLQPLRDVQF